jgi:hypothetical protein
MTQFGSQWNPGQRPAVILLRPKKKRQRRGRWAWLWLLVALLGFFYISSQIRIRYSFDDIMALMHVHNTLRYRQGFILGCMVVGIVAVLKVLRLK